MGKGGETSQSSSSHADKVEVLIHGKYYDVTNMKHPGGSVIKFYAGKGIDASEAYDNFHIRSEKAPKFLASLSSRPADTKEEKAKALPGQESLLADFEKFRKELEKDGLFKPDYPHMIYRFSEIFIMHAIGLYLVLNGYYYTGALVLGIVCGRCGWLMHEGGHYSLTGNIAFDKFCQVWLFGLGCGMSASWWRIQHNKHHSMPQKISHDPDLDTLPLVAFTQKMVRKCGFPQKLWLKMQGVLFPIITCLLVALGWQFYLHPRHIIRSKNHMELFMIVARYIVFGAIFVPHFGGWGAIKFYLLYTALAADYIFINFAVSHTHLPTVPKEDVNVDWVRYAAIHTMNVKPGPFKFISWWMSFLNFQIEHHLFPCAPQFRFPQISPRVKKFFEDHGLVYDQRSYVDALQVTFKNLHKVGGDVFYG